jgi:hypothetical protein
LQAAGSRAMSRVILHLLQKGQAAALRRWLLFCDSHKPLQRLRALATATFGRAFGSMRRRRLLEGFRLLGSFGASRVATERTRAVETRSLLLSRTHHLHRHHTGGVFLARLHGQRTQRRACRCWVQWKERWTAAARRSEVRAAETRSQLLEGAHQKRSQRLGAQRAIACRLLYVRGALSRALRLWSEGCRVAAGHEERQRAAASVAAAEATLRADRLRAKVAAALLLHRLHFFGVGAGSRSSSLSLSRSRSSTRRGGNAEDDEEDEAAEDDDEEKGAGGAADENGEYDQGRTTSTTSTASTSTSTSTTKPTTPPPPTSRRSPSLQAAPSSASSSTLPDAVRQRLGRAWVHWARLSLVWAEKKRLRLAQGQTLEVARAHTAALEHLGASLVALRLGSWLRKRLGRSFRVWWAHLHSGLQETRLEQARMKLDQDYAGRDIDTGGAILRRHLATANLLRQRRALAKWGDCLSKRDDAARRIGLGVELLQRRLCQRLPRDRQRRALAVWAHRAIGVLGAARRLLLARARAMRRQLTARGWALWVDSLRGLTHRSERVLMGLEALQRTGGGRARFAK